MIASCWVNRLHIWDAHLSGLFSLLKNGRDEPKTKLTMQESLFLKSEEFGHMGRAKAILSDFSSKMGEW